MNLAKHLLTSSFTQFKSKDINRATSCLTNEFSEADLQALYSSHAAYKSSVLEVRCSYCGEAFTILLKNLVLRCQKEFQSEDIVCKVCLPIKLSMLNASRAKAGKAARQGIPFSEASKRKISESNRLAGTYSRSAEWRKGKTIEELYGVDKAALARKGMRENHPGLNGSQPPPHTGFRNSRASKNKMSESRLSFMNDRAKLELWVSPLTGQLVDYKTHMSHTRKIIWQNKPEAEKARIRKQTAERLNSRLFWKDKACSGETESWWENTTLIYQSSYELDYINQCKEKGIRLRRNVDMTLPYIRPSDGEVHYYSPDFKVIGGTGEVTHLVEVKPYEFVVNPKNNHGEYYRITKAKLDVLNEFCILNKITPLVITDMELYGVKRKRNANKKDNDT